MSIPIMALLPPPELHTGLLGPVNQTIKMLKELVPGVEGFMKMNNIKGSGCGGDLNSPTIKKTSPKPQQPASPVRYVLKIHFFIEFGLKMIQFKIQFKTKSKIFIQKNIHSKQNPKYSFKKIFIQ